MSLEEGIRLEEAILCIREMQAHEYGGEYAHALATIVLALSARVTELERRLEEGRE